MSTPPLQPNFDASWAFLQRFHPGRLIVATGITLDKKQLPTDTFGPDEKARFLKWIAACAAMPANCYFSVGEPLKPVTKKMERAEIKAVHYLHVDVDPRVGEDVASEQARILALLRNPPAPLPPPTIIVKSGGGLQGYWALKEPLAVDGVEAVAEDIKLYNVAIERALGGDNCHDISRIMRLPGTINLPDAKKLKKGRVPALAEVVEWHDDRVYSIAQFTKAVVVQSSSASGASIGDAPKIKAPGNVRRFNDVDELGEKVSELCKVVIINGFDPQARVDFPSRSEALFWVVCELVRAEVPDEDIYATIVNKDWKISESVLEAGPRAERYALRQIERATEQAIDPVLREFNDRFAVVENYGGKCVVIEEVLDEGLHRFRLTKQGFDHFRNRNMNREVVVGSKKGVDQTMPAGEWWLRHTQRRQYNKIVFAPGRDVPGAYNLFRGFGCDAKPGECGLFLDHIRNIVCGGVEDYYNFSIGWMANTVQNPGEQGRSAIIMRGKKGCGKTLVPKLFGRLFGRHYLAVSNSKHLVGNFNAHLRDCVLLLADEGFWAGNKAHESVLKTLVTEPQLIIEGKGLDVETSANCIHLMMCSNEQWVVPTSYDERRYFMLDVLPDKIGNKEYFDAIVKQMENGGYEALLHFLLAYDLTAWKGRGVPTTKALRKQAKLNECPEMKFVISLATDGIPADVLRRPDTPHAFRAETVCKGKAEETEGLYPYMRRTMPELRDKSKDWFSSVLLNIREWLPTLPDGWAFQYAKDNRGAFYLASPLKDLRAAIDERSGEPTDWPGGPAAEWGWAEADEITDHHKHRCKEAREDAAEKLKAAEPLRVRVGGEVFNAIFAAGVARGVSQALEGPF